MMVWIIGRMGAVRLEGKPGQLVSSIVGNYIMIIGLVSVREVDREASKRVSQ
jgi:predicted house-cleaning NTP pyrophosphatase (Maf/HAM1 superfamily)